MGRKQIIQKLRTLEARLHALETGHEEEGENILHDVNIDSSRNNIKGKVISTDVRSSNTPKRNASKHADGTVGVKPRKKSTNNV